jgi:hypothetical protein
VTELLLGGVHALGQLGHAIVLAPLGLVVLYVGWREARR